MVEPEAEQRRTVTLLAAGWALGVLTTLLVIVVLIIGSGGLIR